MAKDSQEKGEKQDKDAPGTRQNSKETRQDTHEARHKHTRNKEKADRSKKKKSSEQVQPILRIRNI